ncbi:hypothetical protein K2F_04610 [Enterococcus thailandicus]|nr:hypothetical protein K2F_04610 [Enterococcus thailandicus]
MYNKIEYKKAISARTIGKAKKIIRKLALAFGTYSNKNTPPPSPKFECVSPKIKPKIGLFTTPILAINRS